MTGIKVTGSDKLADLAKQMKVAGQGAMRRELVSELRKQAKPLVAAQKQSVRSLAGAPSAWKSRAASMTRAKVSTSAKRAGVRVSVGGGQDGRRARHMNRGFWRHPLFGNTEWWYEQTVEPGWFDRPANDAGPKLRAALVNVITNYIAKLRSSL